MPTADGFTRSVARRLAEYQHLDAFDVPPARIRSLTERERSEYEAQFLDKSGKLAPHRLLEAKARLIVACTIEVDSEQLVFGPEHVAQLMQCDSRLINRMYDQARDHVGFDDGEIERLAGNCDTTDDEGRSIAPPAPPVASTSTPPSTN